MDEKFNNVDSLLIITIDRPDKFIDIRLWRLSTFFWPKVTFTSPFQYRKSWNPSPTPYKWPILNLYGTLKGLDRVMDVHRSFSHWGLTVVIIISRLGLKNNRALSLNNPSFSQMVRPKVFVSVSEKATRSSFVIIPSWSTSIKLNVSYTSRVSSAVKLFYWLSHYILSHMQGWNCIMEMDGPLVKFIATQF